MKLIQSQKLHQKKAPFKVRFWTDKWAFPLTKLLNNENQSKSYDSEKRITSESGPKISKLSAQLSESYIKANKGTKICSFYPIYFFHQTALFWCIWSHLDPSNHFWGRWDPGDQIWTQGTFGTKFKNLHFALKTQQYGCLGTRLDPSHQLLGDLDPRGPILGPKSLWPQIQKSALLSQTPTIWVSMDSSGPNQVTGTSTAVLNGTFSVPLGWSMWSGWSGWTGW